MSVQSRFQRVHAEGNHLVSLSSYTRILFFDIKTNYDVCGFIITTAVKLYLYREAKRA